ncbi:MAG: Uma2 family endonuclease [Geitlerinemataceae cyanobacterium]
MTVATTGRTYAPEEYLKLDIHSEIRNEYRDGEIVPVASSTPAHNKTVGAIFALLMSALRKQPYDIFVLSQRLWIPGRNAYRYPDVMVAAKPVELMPNRKDTVMNPILLVEVLSPSTQSVDRGEKFNDYRTIPTLQEYVLISQEEPMVERYARQSKSEWLFTECRGLESSVALRSVEVEVALADLYGAIEFEAQR